MPLSRLKETGRFRLRQPPYPRIDDLAEDIRTRGQTTPLFVQPDDDDFVVLSGCRRLEALRKLNAPTAIVRVFTGLTDEEAYDLAISENQHRDALSEMERANICLELKGKGKTRRQIATRMGWRSEKSVDRYLRLAVDATPALRDAVQQRKLSLNAALAFVEVGLALPEETQEELLADAAAEGLSEKELRRRIARSAGSTSKPSREPIQRLKNGGFILRTLRFDPNKPIEIDTQTESLSKALKRARKLQRLIKKQSQETTR